MIDGERRNELKSVNEYIESNKSLVRERFRGKYHLQPQIGWMNDPNGFVFFKGRYHMFYQLHPYSDNGGLMYWGHAVSDDLVVWEYLPVALAPDEAYDADGCWSGSAIVVGDRLYLVYTGNCERGGKRVSTQNLAYSDDGVRFFKYAENPVIGEKQAPQGTNLSDFRDPYIWKHENRYYLLIATAEAGAGKIQLYEADDLFHWRYKNVFLRRFGCGECWECPNVLSFEETDLLVCSALAYPHGKYAFWNCNSNVYATGKVDYERGEMSASDFSEIDAGLDFYAAQMIRGNGGTNIMSAWMNVWPRRNVTSELGDGWAGKLILPREVSLKNGKLIQKPVSAVEKYYKATVRVTDVLEGTKSYANVSGQVVRLKISADIKESDRFCVSVFADEKYKTDISYDKKTRLIKADRSYSGYPITAGEKDKSEGRVRYAEYIPENDFLKMEIFLDKSSAEIFFGEGELTMSLLSYNPEQAEKIIFSCEGKAKITIEKNDFVF